MTRCPFPRTLAVLASMLVLLSWAHANAQTGNGSLRDAILRGDRSALARMLRRLPVRKLMMADSTGSYLVHLAADRDNAAILDLLLRHGADIGAKDAVGRTAIDIAAARGDEPTMRAILHRCRPSGRYVEPYVNAFCVACEAGHQRIATMMLDAGLDPDGLPRYGPTTLFCAVKYMRIEVYAALLAKGADPLFGARGGGLHGSLLHAAAMAPEAAVDSGIVAGLLALGIDLEARDANGATAVAVAAHDGNMAVLRLLSAAGADLAVPDNEGHTPLHAAAATGRVEAAEFLIAHGVDVNTANRHNRATPLLVAVARNDSAIVAVLLHDGAYPSAAFESGITGLHIASSECAVSIVRMLLDAGAGASVAAHDGTTPLHNVSRAVENVNDTTVARLLLARGAVLDAKDGRGWTPLHIAARWGNQRMVRWLIASGVGVDVPDSSGRTPLMLAAEWGNVQTLRQLLDHGARIELVTRDGHSALHLAVIRNQPDIVHELLDRGCHTDIQDNAGMTALHYAVRVSTSILELLLRHGASAAVRDTAGRTPLSHALGYEREPSGHTRTTMQKSAELLRALGAGD